MTPFSVLPVGELMTRSVRSRARQIIARQQRALEREPAVYYRRISVIAADRGVSIHTVAAEIGAHSQNE